MPQAGKPSPFLPDAATATSTLPGAAAPGRRLRGFAAMSAEKKKEVARMGGRAAHACGRAHQFSHEEAKAAGKKRHQRPVSGAKGAEAGARVAATRTVE
jgi:uncharacterized protein